MTEEMTAAAATDYDFSRHTTASLGRIGLYRMMTPPIVEGTDWAKGLMGMTACPTTLIGRLPTLSAEDLAFVGAVAKAHREFLEQRIRSQLERSDEALVIALMDLARKRASAERYVSTLQAIARIVPSDALTDLTRKRLRAVGDAMSVHAFDEWSFSTVVLDCIAEMLPHAVRTAS